VIYTHTELDSRDEERAGAHQNRVKFHWNARNALIISLLSQYGRPSSLSLIIIPSALLMLLMMMVYFMRCKGQTQ